MKLLWCAVLGLVLWPVPAGAQGIGNADLAHRESEQLIAELASSPCQFLRNGSWHDATAAAAHLQRKYAYFRERGRLASTQDFITLVGSVSSQSGQPYRVRCGNAAPVDSAAWLGQRLQAFRQQARPASPSPAP